MKNYLCEVYFKEGIIFDGNIPSYTVIVEVKERDNKSTEMEIAEERAEERAEENYKEEWIDWISVKEVETLEDVKNYLN